MEGFADLPDGWVEEIEATRMKADPMPARTPLTLATFRQREAENDAYWG